MNKTNKSSIFLKILAFNIVFITTATLIFQLIFYTILDREYIKQYESLNIANTQAVFNNIEQNIITRVAKVTIGIHIDKQLLDKAIGEQLGDFMIIDREARILYEKGGHNLEKYLPEIKDIVTNLEFGEGKLEVQGIDEEMILVYQFSNVIDAIYIRISPKNIFYQDYNSFNNIIKMMCGISIIVNLLGVLLISKRANRTYGKEAAIVMENSDQKEITFDRAMKQISSKIYDLNEKVESTKNIMLGNEIRNITEKNISSQAEEIITKQINYEKLYSCIIKNKGHQGGIDSVKVENLLEHEHLDFKVILVQSKENELYLLIAYNEANYSLTLDWLREFGEKVCDELSIFLIGNSYDTCTSGIIETFKEVKIAREYHYILPDKKWVYYASIDYKNAKATKSHLKIFAQIESAIKSNDYSQVEIKIEQLIVAFQSGQYSSHYCRATLRDLVTHINHLSESYQINSIEAYEYDIRQHFMEIEDIYAFKKWILPVCQTLMSNIESNKEGIGKELEEKILHIIEENLENDISLEFLADQINMRADTLSKLFKVMMGKNYSEYIKEEKLKYALKLLMTKKYSVKDIADKLGYSSTQYFIKIFKEEFGETPKQYQKQNSSYTDKEMATL